MKFGVIGKPHLPGLSSDFKIKKVFYEEETHNEPVLESTTENRTLSFYRSILPAVRHFYGLPAHFVARYEPL